MTTMVEAKQAMLLAFTTAWGTTTPVTIDNEEHNNNAGVVPWVRVTIRHDLSTQETLGKVGNRKFARGGSVFVQVYVLGNEGTDEADTLSTTARNVFEGVSLAGTTVRFKDVIVRETGPSDKWYQTVVEAVFEYDETK